MKTMKQVLADFQRMQNQLYGKFGRGIIEVRAYDNGDGYWSVSIQVSRWSNELNKHDVWEHVEWEHYSLQDGDDEDNNLARVAEFKAKFDLK